MTAVKQFLRIFLKNFFQNGRRAEKARLQTEDYIDDKIDDGIKRRAVPSGRRAAFDYKVLKRYAAVNAYVSPTSRIELPSAAYAGTLTLLGIACVSRQNPARLP